MDTFDPWWSDVDQAGEIWLITLSELINRWFIDLCLIHFFVNVYHGEVMVVQKSMVVDSSYHDMSIYIYIYMYRYLQREGIIHVYALYICRSEMIGWIYRGILYISLTQTSSFCRRLRGRWLWYMAASTAMVGMLTGQRCLGYDRLWTSTNSEGAERYRHGISCVVMQPTTTRTFGCSDYILLLLVLVIQCTIWSTAKSRPRPYFEMIPLPPPKLIHPKTVK